MTAAVEGTSTLNPQTTTTRTTRATRPTVARTAVYRHIRDNLGTLDLTVRKGEKVEEFSYYLEDLGVDHDDRHECDTDDGDADGSARALRCFRLTKARHQQKAGEPTNYDLRIDADAEDTADGVVRAVHSCECLGFLRWGRCKHVSSLLALIRRGTI